MSKVLEIKKTNDVVLVLDYLVESKEYQAFKQKITQQILRNVQVPGFRKGKAPEHLLMKHVNLLALNDNIIRETIDKYAPEGVKALEKEVETIKRELQSIELDANPEHTKETEVGFQFRLVAVLYPEVDLSYLDQMEYPDVKDTDLPADRPSQKDFITMEKVRFLTTYNQFTDSSNPAQKSDQVIVDFSGKINEKTDNRLTGQDVTILLGGGSFLPDLEKGLEGVRAGETKDIEVKFPKNYFEKTLAGQTAVFTVVVKTVKSAKYKDLQDLFAHSNEAKKQFADEVEFEKFLVDFYDAETEKLREDIRRAKINKELVDKIPEFQMEMTRIEKETDRIIRALRQQADSNQMSLTQVYAKTALLNFNGQIPKDEIEVQKFVNEYVNREFKLAAILNAVYRTMVEPKLTSSQVEAAAAEVAKNPTHFGLEANASKTEIKNFTYDRLQKQLALDRILDILKAKQQDKTTKTDDKKKETQV
jgi:trigger factor